MAHIDTRSASLAPSVKPKPAPRPKQDKTVPINCDYCGGLLGRAGRAKRTLYTVIESDVVCSECAKFFGLFDTLLGMGGSTNLSYDSTVNRMQDLRESGYGMVLINRTFGAPDGAELTLEMGDVFKITVPDYPRPPANEACSWQRSLATFTVTCMIGNYPVTLFLHEISPINFLTIMKLRKAGELEEAYVAQDDEIGHFRPTTEMRAAIDNTFGPRF